MKKIYIAPSAERVAFNTEEILEISYTGTGSFLEDKTNSDKKPATDFGNVSLF